MDLIHNYIDALTILKTLRRSGRQEGPQPELTEDQKKYIEEYAKKKSEEKGGEEAEAALHRSMFHGKEEKDYHGWSTIGTPKGAKAAIGRCYIPKSLVDTWSGHTKDV